MSWLSLTTIFAPIQVLKPKLRVFGAFVTDVDLEKAECRRTGVPSGTSIRNQFYFELMRCKPHYPGTGSASAPDYVIAGCEAAFPWTKKGTAYAETAFSDHHRDAYLSAPGVEDTEVQQIMDLLLSNVVPK